MTHGMPRHDDSLAGYDTSVWCDLHQRLNCTLCDECGHEGAQHLNGHEAREAGELAQAGYLFANATCWAENICSACSPERHARAQELARNEDGIDHRNAWRDR